MAGGIGTLSDGFGELHVGGLGFGGSTVSNLVSGVVSHACLRFCLFLMFTRLSLVWTW